MPDSARNSLACLAINFPPLGSPPSSRRTPSRIARRAFDERTWVSCPAAAARVRGRADVRTLAAAIASPLLELGQRLPRGLHTLLGVGDRVRERLGIVALRQVPRLAHDVG